MKEIEYAEALNDIADVLDMPTGATAAEIVKKARDRWANGVHTCHERCTREKCVQRRELKAMREALKNATELLGEIMRDEVNHQDEAEKWLRAYGDICPANVERIHPYQRERSPQSREGGES